MRTIIFPKPTIPQKCRMLLGRRGLRRREEGERIF